jgi:hypothetical protein
MTALSIVQSVARRVGLTAPSVLFTSTDRNVGQLRELLIEGAEALSKAGSPQGWQALQAEQTFVTVAQIEQTNTPIPADFRRFVPDSFFNRTTNRKVTGPLTPQEYQQAQVWPQLTAPYLTFRERESTFLIDPAPPAGETIAYEYISAYWATNSAGVAKAAFTADDDGTYLDEELLKLDLRWRWKAAKGLDYGEDMITFERARDLALGDDGGSGSLNQGGPNNMLPDWRYNVPEGNWPS